MDSQRETLLKSFHVRKLEKWLENVLIKNAVERDPGSCLSGESSRAGGETEATVLSEPFHAKTSSYHLLFHQSDIDA